MTVPQLFNKFPPIFETCKFITMFTTAHHVSLFWARLIQSTSSNPISLGSTLTIFSKQCLFLASISSFRFHHQNLACISLLPCSCYIPCPSYLLWFVLTNNIWWEVPTYSSSLCNFLQSPVTSSLWRPSTFLSTSAYIIPLMQQTRFHTHIKQQAKSQPCTFKYLHS